MTGASASSASRCCRSVSVALRGKRGRIEAEPESRAGGRGEDRLDERHQHPVERHLRAVGRAEVLEEADRELPLDDVGEVGRVRADAQLLLVGEEHEHRPQVVAVGLVVGKRPREQLPAQSGLGEPVDVQVRFATAELAGQVTDREQRQLAVAQPRRVDQMRVTRGVISLLVGQSRGQVGEQPGPVGRRQQPRDAVRSGGGEVPRHVVGAHHSGRDQVVGQPRQHPRIDPVGGLDIQRDGLVARQHALVQGDPVVHARDPDLQQPAPEGGIEVEDGDAVRTRSGLRHDLRAAVVVDGDHLDRDVGERQPGADVTCLHSCCERVRVHGHGDSCLSSCARASETGNGVRAPHGSEESDLALIRRSVTNVGAAASARQVLATVHTQSAQPSAAIRSSDQAGATPRARRR